MKILSIILSLIFLIHSHILLAVDQSEEEILNKLSECITYKKSKRVDLSSHELDNSGETSKKEFICTKESVNELLISLRNNTKQENKNLYIVIFVSTGSLFLLIYFLYLRQNKQNKILKQDLQTSRALDVEYDSQSNDLLSAKIMNIEARQAGIEETLDSFLGKVMANLDRTNYNSEQSGKEEPNFYMTFPKPDGSFPQASKRKNKEGTSYIFFPISDTRAEFELSYDREMLGRILNGHEIYIEPACEPLNEVNFRAQQIITIEKGEAFKEGSIWKIFKKAKIKYD